MNQLMRFLLHKAYASSKRCDESAKKHNFARALPEHIHKVEICK